MIPDFFSLPLASFLVPDFYPTAHRVLTNQIKVTAYMPVYIEIATKSALYPKTLCETLIIVP